MPRIPRTVRIPAARSTLFAALFCLGCGDSGSGRDVGPGDGAVASCGQPGSVASGECRNFRECRVPSNVGTPLCSTNCPTEALLETCSAGECIEYDRSGIIEAGFTINAGAKDGQSYVGMVIDPLMADGTRVTCAALLSTCSIVGNDLLNVINVQVGSEGRGGPLQQDNTYLSLASAHVGTDRLYLVHIANRPDGQGQIVSRGCAEGIEVVSGEKTRVVIVLQP